VEPEELVLDAAAYICENMAPSKFKPHKVEGLLVQSMEFCANHRGREIFGRNISRDLQVGRGFARFVEIAPERPLQADSRDMLEDLDHMRKREELLALACTMTAMHRSVYVRHFVLDQDVETVASALKLTPRTVRQYAHEVRKGIADAYAKNHNSPSLVNVQ
jgi:DNA-directed RNA polymerase specialized sigma24 family protein